MVYDEQNEAVPPRNRDPRCLQKLPERGAFFMVYDEQNEAVPPRNRDPRCLQKLPEKGAFFME